MDDKILANNLHRLMSDARLTASELGRHLNLPAATIKKLRTGENKNPTITTLLPIAKHFRINISQLIGEIPLINKHRQEIISRQYQISNTDKLTNIVPIINWIESTEWTTTITTSHHESSTERRQIPLERQVSKFAYALILDTNYSSFKKDGIIIVEPTANNFIDINQINSQDTYVLIHKLGQHLPNLKKLLTEDGNLYIQSLIPELNITQRLTDEYSIIGRVIAYTQWLADNLHQ